MESGTRAAWTAVLSDVRFDRRSGSQLHEDLFGGRDAGVVVGTFGLALVVVLLLLAILLSVAIASLFAAAVVARRAVRLVFAVHYDVVAITAAVND